MILVDPLMCVVTFSVRADWKQGCSPVPEGAPPAAGVLHGRGSFQPHGPRTKCAHCGCVRSYCSGHRR